MSELYPALRPREKEKGVLTRVIEAAVKAWRESDDAEIIRAEKDRFAQPSAYLDEAERFLDQFLLSYFHSVIIVPNVPPAFPWRTLCDMNPFLSRMPELWRDTKQGCMLTRTQLDYVGGLLYERLRGKL